VEEHGDRLGKLHEERVNCQLAAGTKFATHGEVGAMFREASGTSAEVLRKLEHVSDQGHPPAGRIGRRGPQGPRRPARPGHR